jgi:hypothetical protein
VDATPPGRIRGRRRGRERSTLSPRSSEGRRYRKQPKIDALRQYKEEILEAHRWAASAALKSDWREGEGLVISDWFARGVSIPQLRSAMMLTLTEAEVIGFPPALYRESAGI